MSGFITILIIIIWLVVIARNSSRTDRAPRRLTYRSLRSRLDLDVRPRPQTETPLYRRIKAIVAEHPDQPLVYDDFPLVPAEEADRFYYPGAYDIFSEIESRDDAWKTVVAATMAAGRNKLTDWQVLEHNVKPIPFRASVDDVLGALQMDDITHNVRSLFLEMARGSSDYNAIKWGIMIGAVHGLKPEEVDDLLLLARHAEFVLPVSHAFARDTGWHSEHYRLLPGLLPVTEGWGLFQVVRRIQDEPLLWNDPTVRRDTVIHAMSNGSVAKLSLAMMISTHKDFARILENAEDAPLRFALLDLLETLIWKESLPGAMPRFEDGVGLVRRYLALIESAPYSIEVLSALRSMFIVLGHDEITWEEKGPLRERVESMLLERLGRETIVDAIRSGNHRETALLIIMEGGMSDLAYAALEEFHREPSPLAVDVLGTIGTIDHVRELLQALPDREEIAARGAFTRTSVITTELNDRSLLYAALVRYIGKLGTPEAIERIKEAARDFHPVVKASAMVGMRTLRQWTLDAESKALVRACLNDSLEFVRQEAEETGRYHALHASLHRAGAGTVAIESGLSLN